MTWNTTPLVFQSGGVDPAPDDRSVSGHHAGRHETTRSIRPPAEKQPHVAGVHRAGATTHEAVGWDGRGGRGGRGAVAVPSVMAPDGTRAVFVRDWNLWVRDTESGKESPLTTDGVKDFGYATDNAGWSKSDRPIVVWSPDSKRIATFQQDQRGVGEMYLVSTQVGHPSCRPEMLLPGTTRSRCCTVS
jgi:hypothetical protein